MNHYALPISMAFFTSICNVVPCSTETNTEFVTHLLLICKTTFNTPFGRYRWNQMPFSVCSAPEVWQRTMHESVEDLEGVEMIADDFLIAGFGIGDREVNNNLKKTWTHFSQEMPLVEAEIESCQSETAPVKHEIHGSAIHLSGPEKIQAILQMPEPKDITALKRFLGMVTYLAKFIPHPSETTEPLRRLEDKNVEFQWLPQHSLAKKTIKKSLTETPVLRHYDVNKPITIQCDASQSGLGAEVHIQKWNSQVTQASAANAAGPTKVKPWSAMQERYTYAYCKWIKSGISEDHWWSADEMSTWDSWSWRAYSNWTTETRCFPWTNWYRWWYSGTYPCYQARVARHEKMPPCCPTVLW